LIYKSKNQNCIFEEKRVSLRDLNIDDIKEKVFFMQGDPSNLKDVYKDFDLIFCSNLIERVSNLSKVLQDIQHRINNNGLLIFLSPIAFIEENNLKENLNNFELLEIINISSDSQINIWKKKS